MNLINRILQPFGLRLSPISCLDGVSHEQVADRERELRRKIINLTSLNRYYRLKSDRLSQQLKIR